MSPRTDHHLLLLSADTADALAEHARRWADHLERHPGLRARDVCFVAAVGRSPRRRRLACVAADTAGLARALRAFVAGDPDAAQTGEAPEQPPTLAFAFTGQGSQYAGMARGLYDRWPAFRAALDRCAAIARPWLARDLLAVLHPDPDASPDASIDATANGDSRQLPDASIDDTAWTQPALFAVEYALCELLASWGLRPDLVLGHSIGEFVAATRAGVFSLEDALRLVVARGQHMAATAPGCMWSVRADAARLAPLLAGRAHELALAAINAPDQCVLSGVPAAVEAVVEVLRADGVECRALRVSHAFHSPLMDPALEPFRAVVAATERHPAALPMIDNLSGALAGDDLQTVERWVQHLRAPVAFAAGLDALARAGARVVLEVGAHPALTSLAAANPAAAQLSWVPTLQRKRDDQVRLLSALGRLFTLGVPIDWDSFHAGQGARRVELPTYPFQRRSHWNVDPRWLDAPAAAEPAADRLFATHWVPQPPSIAPTLEPGTWWLHPDRHGLAAALAAALTASGARVVLAPETPPDGPLRGVLDLRALDLAPTADPTAHERGALDPRGLALDPDSDPTAHERGAVDPRGLDLAPDLDPTAAERAVLAAVDLIHDLSAAPRHPAPRLWLLTRGAQRLADRDPVTPAARALWGLARVVGNEHPDLRCSALDLDPAAPADEALALRDLLLHADAEDQLALRGGQRHVARLRALAPAAPVALDGTWLISGGLGALGRHVAVWLARHGARHLALLGRSPGDLDRRDPPGHERGADLAALTAELREHGATLSVHRCDVADRDALAAVLAAVRADHPRLTGVIHAAGVLDDAILANLDRERLHTVMAPKLGGAWNLHALTAADDLRHFVLFSSTAALLGNPGQGNYAAANAALDGLAEARRAAGRPAVSVQWGPWSGGGMSTRAAGRRPSPVLADLAPAEALDALAAVLGHERPVVAAGAFQWARLTEVLGAAEAPPALSELLSAAAPTHAAPPLLRDHLRQLDPEAREQRVRAWLGDQFARLFGRPVDDPQQNLTELGIDSLLVVELLSALRRDLQLMLYPREFYQNPSLAALARYIARELDTTGAPSGAAPEPLTGAALAPWHTRAELTPRGGPRNPPAAFVLSSPRSGSTLLRVMLAGHPRLFSPPELHLLAFDTLQERQRALAGSYLDEGLQRALMEVDGLDAEASTALLQTWLARDMSVQDVYSHLQARAAGKLLIDKSPSYAASMDTLLRAEQIFAGARYIQLARHPYAVIESFTRMRMDRMMLSGGHDPFDVAEQSWRLSNENLLALRERVDPARFHLIRYEDLVHNLEHEARALCDFLEIPFDPAVLDPYQGQRMTDGVHARSMPIDDPNFHTRKSVEADLADVWRTIRLPRLLSPESQRVARALGYELPVEDAAAPLAHHQDTREIRGLQQVCSVWTPADAPLDHAPADRPPVVLVHGLLDHGPAWAEVAAALVARGHRVLAPDLRGHGHSAHINPGASYQLLDFVADLDAWVDATTTGPIVLAGHSFGASVASLYARLRPQRVRALALIEPGLPAARPAAADSFADLDLQLDHLSARPEHAVLPDLAAAAARLRLQIPALSPAQALCTAERLTAPVAGGLIWRWDARLRLRTLLHPSVQGFTRGDYLALLARLSADLPVWALFGATSDFNRPEDRQAQLEQLAPARTATIPGGHFLHVEAPSEVARLLLAAIAPT